jgi:hypothetical protein
MTKARGEKEARSKNRGGFGTGAAQICFGMSLSVKRWQLLVANKRKRWLRLDPHAKGIDKSPAQVRLSEIHSQWMKRIPASAEELWQWLLDQEHTVD